jgi:hypothetical protein
MGQRWTDEMQTDLERWQASEAEPPSPVDFLIIEPGFRDVLRGLLSFVVAVIRYRLLGGVESPWSLRQEIGFANTNRQLGTARVVEIEEWLSDELDFFETSDRHNA